jgi:hypothetical protein
MKVSEITNKELANYLRLEYADLTVDEKADLDTLLGVSKAYIKSFTGLEDIGPVGEIVGTGDGIATIFYVANINVIADSEAIYVNGIKKLKTVDYIFEDTTGKIEFIVAPALNAIVTADYQAVLVDNFDDFVIVIYILVQDMYDNRTLYVDKNNMNKVVETILGMHSVNLL